MDYLVFFADLENSPHCDVLGEIAKMAKEDRRLLLDQYPLEHPVFWLGGENNSCFQRERAEQEKRIKKFQELISTPEAQEDIQIALQYWSANPHLFSRGYKGMWWY